MKRFSTLVTITSFLFLFSCSTWQDNTRNWDKNRNPSSDNQKAIDKFVNACASSNTDMLQQLIDENAVENGATQINAASGSVVFLMKDGRLVIASGLKSNAKESKKCAMDHLKLDEGKVVNTKNIGRRLFLSVENKKKSRRVYVLTFVADSESPKPYELHELKYAAGKSFASAESFKVENREVRGYKTKKAHMVVIKKDGEPYKNGKGVFRPFLWGNSNEQIDVATNGLARSITVRDLRQRNEFEPAPQRRSHTQQQIVTYLPKPKKTCVMQDKLSFYFGFFEFSVSAKTVMKCGY